MLKNRNIASNTSLSKGKMSKQQWYYKKEIIRNQYLIRIKCKKKKKKLFHDLKMKKMYKAVNKAEAEDWKFGDNYENWIENIRHWGKT